MGGGNRLHGEIGPTERLGLDDDRGHGAGGDRPTEIVDRARRLVDGHRDRRLRTDRGDLVDAGRWFLADRDVERRQPVQDLQRLVGTPTAVGIESELDLVADRVGPTRRARCPPRHGGAQPSA